MNITFNLSENFMKSEFIRTGKQQKKTITADVELTPAQAKNLLDIFGGNVDYVNGKISTHRLFPDSKNYITLTVNTTDVQLAIAEAIKTAEVVKIKNEKEEIEKEQELHKVISENRRKYLNNETAVKSDLRFFSVRVGENVDQETADYFKSVSAKLKKEREEKEYNDNKEKEENKEKLKNWAKLNASELVKLRIEENMNWFDLADFENVCSIKPDGFEPIEMLIDDEKYAENFEIKNPTIEQLKALQEAKKHYSAYNPTLTRFKFVEPANEYNEDGIDIVTHKDVITIIIRSIANVASEFFTLV